MNADPAETLAQRALSLIPRGDWAGAAAALEQAAALHAQAKRTYDDARCLQLAATLRRLAVLGRACLVTYSDSQAGRLDPYFAGYGSSGSNVFCFEDTSWTAKWWLNPE